MKLKFLTLLMYFLGISSKAHLEGFYNKDGNNIDLYIKIDGLHYFSSEPSKDGEQSYVRRNG